MIHVCVQKNQANVEFWYVIEEMRDNVLQVQKAVEAKLGQETELQLHKVMIS